MVNLKYNKEKMATYTNQPNQESILCMNVVLTSSPQIWYDFLSNPLEKLKEIKTQNLQEFQH